MPIVVGISLRNAGKVYSFDPAEDHYHIGEVVLVETARGLELGHVRVPPHEVSEENIVAPLKRVIRRAVNDDLVRDHRNRAREENALDVCRRHVEKLNLSMRLIDAQYTFDGSQVLIHFLAENRVDFRELVRELARELHTRIELRQVGVRDEAKLIGGHGMCGRTLCCASFLSNFSPVGINMAKVQGLALNPQKISGVCGRLMCCLAYEFEHYKDIRADLPRVNAEVMTPQGPGKVTKLNLLSHQVEVTLPDCADPIWMPVDQVMVKEPDGTFRPLSNTCSGCAHHGEDELPCQSQDSDEYDLSEFAGPSQREKIVQEKPEPEPDKPRGRGRRDRQSTPNARQPQAQGNKQRPPRDQRPAAQPPAQNADQPAQAGQAGERKIPSGRYRPRHRRRKPPAQGEQGG